MGVLLTTKMVSLPLRAPPVGSAFRLTGGRVEVDKSVCRGLLAATRSTAVIVVPITCFLFRMKTRRRRVGPFTRRGSAPGKPEVFSDRRHLFRAVWDAPSRMLSTL